MEKIKKSSFDGVLFATVVILSLFGLIMIFSASAPSAFVLHGDSFYFVKKQLIWTVLGFGALLFCASFDYKKYKKFGMLMYVLNIILLILVLIIGVETKGAKRWINLGIGTFQPSEFTKVSIVILLAMYFTSMEKSKQSFSNIYVPLLVIVGIPCALLLLQPHFSVIIIICGTVFTMLLSFGIKFKFYVPLIFLGLGAGGFLAISEPYRLKRITAYLDPFQDKLGDGWQIVQSLYAISSGGIFGLGLSRSRQKHLYIPEPQNDYIFSIICEELGLIGATLVIVLFGILLFRCIKIAVDCPDSFGTYMAFGMSALIIIQVILNIGVAINLLPATGIPLPFFSAGGSSFVFQMIAMGIVLNISRYKRG
ncbi:MAG: putative lipid II flippase FtsW [Ruminococcaceae bacterium]|nr:putative lipid II flippase FtsW [Oscillospiraceae bacterium]